MKEMLINLIEKLKNFLQEFIQNPPTEGEIDEIVRNALCEHRKQEIMRK